MDFFYNELIFESNITVADIKLNFPKKRFLLDVLLAWTKIKGNFKTTHQKEENIWNNLFLKIGVKLFLTEYDLIGVSNL